MSLREREGEIDIKHFFRVYTPDPETFMKMIDYFYTCDIKLGCLEEVGVLPSTLSQL